jgi:hypothetical protein
MEQTGQRDGGRVSRGQKSEVTGQKFKSKRPNVKASGRFSSRDVPGIGSDSFDKAAKSQHPNDKYHDLVEQMWPQII